MGCPVGNRNKDFSHSFSLHLTMPFSKQNWLSKRVFKEDKVSNNGQVFKCWDDNLCDYRHIYYAINYKYIKITNLTRLYAIILWFKLHWHIYPSDCQCCCGLLYWNARAGSDSCFGGASDSTGTEKKKQVLKLMWCFFAFV